MGSDDFRLLGLLLSRRGRRLPVLSGLGRRAGGGAAAAAGCSRLLHHLLRGAPHNVRPLRLLGPVAAEVRLEFGHLRLRQQALHKADNVVH